MDPSMLVSEIRSATTSLENHCRDVSNALYQLVEVLETHAQQQSDHLQEMVLLMEKQLSKDTTSPEPSRNADNAASPQPPAPPVE